MTVVCKFGGSSLATKDGILAVKELMEANRDRRFVVVSAIGSAYAGQEKVTDLLIRAHRGLCGAGLIKMNVLRKQEVYAKKRSGACKKLKRLSDASASAGAGRLRISVDGTAKDGRSVRVIYPVAAYNEVCARYVSLSDELGLHGAGRLLYDCYTDIVKAQREDFTYSRGEYLCGLLVARFLGVPFIDGTGILAFNNGVWDCNASIKRAAQSLNGHERAVIAGYYGSDSDGAVKILTRGGSDVTGAVVSAAVYASLYENYTDVDGFLTTDPRVIPKARLIECLDYDSLCEMSYYGAKVLHYQTVLPLKKSLIPCKILNTFNSASKGTVIAHRKQDASGMTLKNGCRMLTVSHDTVYPSAQFLRYAPSRCDKTFISARTLSFAAQNIDYIRDDGSVLFSHITRQEMFFNLALALVYTDDADALFKILTVLKREGIKTLFIERQALCVAVIANECDLKKAYPLIYDSIF